MKNIYVRLFFLVVFVTFLIDTKALAEIPSSEITLNCNSKEIKLESFLPLENKYKFFAEAVDEERDLGEIEFYEYSIKHGEVVILNNRSYLPLEMKAWLFNFKEKVRNVKANIPEIILIPPQSQRIGFVVCAKKKNKRWNYDYDYDFGWGYSTNTHNWDKKYLLPFKVGETHTVNQGETGSFSHFGPNLYAIDFNLPEGTEFTAMRDGVVVFVKEDSNEGGPEESFRKKGNSIWILHDDGSLGKYHHLMQNGALVKVGDKIKAGDILGYSGNTGFSKGPHLHVQVVLLKGLSEEENIPIRFKGIDGPLIEDESYTATR